jgi:peptidoglycan/xylan/chitin deacetylase (PgdA/CDA1 family)
MGYEVVLWNLDSFDTKKNFPRKAGPIANQILTHAHQGSIVLAHDIHPYTVEAIKMVVPALKRKKYSFVNVRILRGQAAAASSTN